MYAPTSDSSHRYCPNNHLLTKDNPPAFTCDTCNKAFRAGTDSYACRTCFYDTCTRCFHAPTCRAQHVLKKRPVSIKFMCDLCHKVFKAGTDAHSCRNDNFDCCTTCFEQVSKQKWAKAGSDYSSSAANRPRFTATGEQMSSSNSNGHNNTSSIPPPTMKIPTPQQRQEALLSAPKGTRCRSLFIGCQYYRTKGELRGSVNDVFTTMKLLRALGFDLAMTKVLVDDRNFIARTGNPDRRTIEKELNWLIDGAKASDHLFLHFAGHATQVPHQQASHHQGRQRANSDNNNSSFCEALVPVDYQKAGYITDDFLFENFFTKVPPGCRLTCVFDTAIYSASFGSDLEFEWKFEEDLTRFKQTKRSFTRPVEERDAKLSRFLSSVNNTNGNLPDILVFSSWRDAMSMPAPEGQDIAEYTFHFATKHQHPGREVSGGLGQSLVSAIASKIGRDGKPHVSFDELLMLMQKGLMNELGFRDRVVNVSSTKKLDFDAGFSIFGGLPESSK